jgi:predicted TIM-barrel fold metal-dependent hydrolase
MIFDAHTHLIGGITQNIEIMNRLGIVKAVLLPDSSSRDYVRESNEVIKVASLYSSVFYPFCIVDPKDEHAVENLKKFMENGFKGLKLHPLVQGVAIHDALYDKIIGNLKKSMPVLIHTGTPVYSMPFQFLELAKRHPNVTFIMGHSGLDYWYDAIRAAKRADNIILDTTGIRFPKVIEYMCKELGPERIVYGSDLPFLSADIELYKIQLLNLSTDDRNKILYENIYSILEK